MNIGNKIRELRRARGITQEQLAAGIGISYQAVSKWECGIALPDITLVPILANFFGVSTDELFDFNLQKTEDAVMKIVDAAHEHRETDPAKARLILEAGLKEYPENDILLNNLLYVITDPEESVRIAQRAIAATKEAVVRYDALRFIAYAYKKMGDPDSAKAAIGQIPEIYFTKLTELAFLLEGDEKYAAAEKQKWISFENLLQMMWKITEYYEASGEIGKAVAEAEKARRLIPILENSRFDKYAEFIDRNLPRLRARM